MRGIHEGWGYGGGVVGVSLILLLSHTHTTPYCTSEAVTKQRGEKGSYLPEPTLRKERGINSTFLFFSSTAPSPLHPPTLIALLSERTKARTESRRGEVKAGVGGGGTHLIRG